MKLRTVLISSTLSVLLFSQCEKDKDKNYGMFTVTIENVMEAKSFFESGVFNTPVGASEPGGAAPGNSYEFSFNAGKGHKLSFATMYVKSNDLFFAPADEGIELYNGDSPISGDITAEIMLWDAGTEVNEEPGTGPNQPLNGGANVGTEENGTVKELSMVNDGFTYPSVESTIKVMITNDGGTEFTVTINNLPESITPIAPGVYVVHTNANPLFEDMMADYGDGLEGLAEDGDPSTLDMFVADNSGLVSPLAPGVWAVHKGATMPVFSNNSADYGEGLEALAEDGDPSTLATSLDNNSDVKYSGVFNTPDGASGAGPLFPGEKYSFSFNAAEGYYLSFATMLVQSNDLFFSPSDMGLSIFTDGVAINGDITSLIKLWDAGTETNQYPGAGLNQPPRVNGGDTENGVVKEVNDGFIYPTVSDVIKVTITQQ